MRRLHIRPPCPLVRDIAIHLQGIHTYYIYTYIHASPGHSHSPIFELYILGTIVWLHNPPSSPYISLMSLFGWYEHAATETHFPHTIRGKKGKNPRRKVAECAYKMYIYIHNTIHTREGDCNRKKKKKLYSGVLSYASANSCPIPHYPQP